MMKKLLGKWIGTLAAKEAAFRAASAIVATSLVAAPMAVEYASSKGQAQTESEVVEVAECSAGSVEGTLDLGEWMNEDGTLKGFVDVSEWTQEDLDASNAAKKEAAKAREQAMLEEGNQNWEDFLAEIEKEEQAETEDSQIAANQEVPSEEEPSEEESFEKETSEKEMSDNSKTNTLASDSSNKEDTKYATPGSVGPNGEKVRDIAELTGAYQNDNGPTAAELHGMTEEEYAAFKAEQEQLRAKQAAQEEECAKAEAEYEAYLQREKERLEEIARLEAEADAERAAYEAEINRQYEENAAKEAAKAETLSEVPEEVPAEVPAEVLAETPEGQEISVVEGQE